MKVIKHLQIIALLVSSTCFAPANADEIPCPATVLLIEYDPWRTVIGSDSPTFALYQDGRTIFRHEKQFQHTSLTSEEFGSIIDGASSLANLDSFYPLSRSTDQITQLFSLCTNGKTHHVEVYGSLRHDDIREVAPSELVALFDQLTTFTGAQAEPWLPETIEVMIWDYNYAPDESIIWPSEWPDLNASNTVQRGDDSYSLFLSSEHLEELKLFLASRNQKGAIEMNGKKWAAGFRYPFPHENLAASLATED